MDLVAIAPATRTVALGRAAVEVTGLSLRKLTHLIVEYPHLVPLAAGGEVDLSKLVMESADAALSIFSIGVVGTAIPTRRFWQRRATATIENDAGLLAAFDQATAGQQLDCLAAIVDLTFEGKRAIPFLKAIFGTITRPPQEPSPSIRPEPMPEPSSDSSPGDTPIP